MSESINRANTNPIVNDNVVFLSALERVARAKQQEWANAHPDANPQTNPYSFLRGSDFKKVEFAKLMKPGIFSRTNEDINQAVDMWCNFATRAEAEVQYGSISEWNTSNVTDMKGLFWNKRRFNDDISAWNVGNVTNMDYMFRLATSFNGDIGAWNVRNVTTMECMFDSAESFNRDISAWNVRNVTEMDSMFTGAASFNSDISAWDVRNVRDMGKMFCDATSFTSDISAWNVRNVTSMVDMFRNCPIPENHKPTVQNGQEEQEQGEEEQVHDTYADSTVQNGQEEEEQEQEQEVSLCNLAGKCVTVALSAVVAAKAAGFFGGKTRNRIYKVTRKRRPRQRQQSQRRRNKTSLRRRRR